MEVNIMAWKDYETLDATPETATKKKLEKYTSNMKMRRETLDHSSLLKEHEQICSKKKFPKYK